MDRQISKPFALLLAGSTVLTASGTAIAANAHSTADGIRAELSYRGQAVHLGPVDRVTGRPSGAYDFAVAVADFQEDTSVPVVFAPRIVAAAKNINGHVASTGLTTDSISSQGDVSFVGDHIALFINPPPTAGGSGNLPPQPAVPFLTIAAREVNSVSYYSKVFPHGITANGTASMGSLKIAGSYFGGHTLKFSGTPAPNTVIYSSPALTITLNRQIVPMLSPCSTCAPQPVSIETVAIDVELKHVVAYGHAVRGEVRIGSSKAQ
jgi:hypothetical protein